MTDPNVLDSSLSDERLGWTTLGSLRFSALFFGPSLSADSPVSVIVRCGSDLLDRVTGSHSLDTSTMTVVVDGSMQLDGHWMKAGDIRVVPTGAEHGDLLVGPDGVTFVKTFAKRRGLRPHFTNADDEMLFAAQVNLDALEAVASGKAEGPVPILSPRAFGRARRGIST